MATIRHTQLRREPAPEIMAQPEEDPNKVMAADESAIDSLLDGLDVSGGAVKVYRREPLGTKFGYVMSFPVEDFSLESLKIKSGGGDYKLAIYNASEKKVRQVQFSIDSRVQGLLDPQRLPAAPVASGNGGTDMIQLLLQQSQAAAAAQQQMFMQMLQMQQASTQQMTQVLVAAMSGGKAPTVNAAGEPASQLLASMMPLLLANAKGSTTDLGAQLQHLKALKELAGSAGTEEKDDKEDGIMGKIVEYGGPLLSAFLASRQQQQIPMQQAQVITHPMQQAEPVPKMTHPVQPTQSSTVQIPPEYQQLVAMLQGFTPLLINAAQQNSDVLTYQAMVDDVLDDAAYAVLQKILAQDNWVEALFSNDAGVRAHLPWFESLRDTLLNPEAYDESPDPITAAQTKAAGVTTLNGAGAIHATASVGSSVPVSQTILVP